MRFVIVTGMSGAGKATALKTLEDAGFFCVDNLPIQLIKRFAEIAYDEQIQVDDVAISVDIRSGRALSQLNSCLADIRREGMNYEILFIECSNATLVKRYKETRRNHPLSVKGGRIIDGINKERELIGFLKEEADYIIDTTNLLVREFKAELDKIFVQNEEYSNFIITVMSFGFKYGLPLDADLVFDVRFLPNPHYITELRDKNGTDKEVYDYVMEHPQSEEFYENLMKMLVPILPAYKKEGKSVLTIAFGCTGGQHRSVAFAERVSAALKDKWHLNVSHRDKDRRKETVNRS